MNKEILIKKMKERIEMGTDVKITLILSKYNEQWNKGNPLSPNELRKLLEDAFK